MTLRDLRISAQIRTEISYHKPLFSSSASTAEMLEQAQELSHLYNSFQNEREGESFLSAGKLSAVGTLHLLYQNVISRFLIEEQVNVFDQVTPQIIADPSLQETVADFAKEFPSLLLMEQNPTIPLFLEETNRSLFVHHLLLENKAAAQAASPLLTSPAEEVTGNGEREALKTMLVNATQQLRSTKIDGTDLYSFLLTPSELFPDSLEDQINYIVTNWKSLLPQDLLEKLLRSGDILREEKKAHRFPGGPGPSESPTYSFTSEYEAFSSDSSWMGNVVLIAKSTLVWLDQLSTKYQRPITTLAGIPDAELDILAQRGFNALWLIGIWERSNASKKIKNFYGNTEAVASAYSLIRYDISSSIGGWPAFHDLDARCKARGIRLASDMVPNHTAIDSDWVIDHPEYFISSPWPPFPSYTYSGENLSDHDEIEIKIEDHYYDRTDAAVTFQRVDKRSGETRYIYHGNDGTSMPWNDTAQLDFLNPIVREAVIQQILHVARSFSIIRFDAAMTLAKQHVQRLWYPLPGSGGDVPGRSQAGLDEQTFSRLMPNEFWREVVDRIDAEKSDTLLLAEAFWMMEGYFVRTLGMHRVYNSAFMNMLKNEENHKYRETIKNTLAFDPEILKRFVNFMNNPDEESAIDQFGSGDKYLGVCTLLATMPGLPMFGHGQIEGFAEKYGMEYARAYWDEQPDAELIAKHEQKIFPLLRRRRLFSEADYFELFDVRHHNEVIDSLFAYVNGNEKERLLILYNNRYEASSGFLHYSVPKLERHEDGSRSLREVALHTSLGLSGKDNHFIVWREIASNLYYLHPAKQIAEQGLFVAVQGYQVQIFDSIREIEDVDGSLALLAQQLGSHGTYDLEHDLRKIRLRPLYQVLSPLLATDFISALEALTTSHATIEEFQYIESTITNAYQAVTLTYNALPVSVQSALGLELQPNALKEMQELLSKLFDTFQKGSSLFKEGAIAMSEVNLLIQLLFISLPFVGKHEEPKAWQEALHKLLLSSLFSTELTALGVASDSGEHFLERLVFLITPPQILVDALTVGDYYERELLESLLRLPEVRSFINYNLYNGVLWYRKESFQELILLLAIGLSIQLDSSKRDEIAQLLLCFLQRDVNSEYRIERLLAK